MLRHECSSYPSPTSQVSVVHNTVTTSDLYIFRAFSEYVSLSEFTYRIWMQLKYSLKCLSCSESHGSIYITEYLVAATYLIWITFQICPWTVFNRFGICFGINLRNFQHFQHFHSCSRKTNKDMNIYLYWCTVWNYRLCCFHFLLTSQTLSSSPSKLFSKS